MKTDNHIAIIGMDGIFPEADTLVQFYANLLNGRDSVRELSANRKRFSVLDPSLNYRRHGSLDRVDLFDHPFFGIPKAEADLMDPQQRLLLQLSSGAIENGGYRLSELAGSRTGVFLSASHPTYDKLMDTYEANAVIGNMNAAIAGRIGYLLDLHGPALMIDTACSSSLVAIIEACKNLLAGWVDYALAGGISLNMFFPVRQGEGGLQEVEGADEKCKAFDQSANGIVGGEGGGIVVLKRLADALRDGDTIQAVIRGFASNQDGRRAVGLTAPSPVAQTEVLLAAWQQADIDPATLTAMEAHGTGTKLGDPIELRALRDAFAQHTSDRQFCAIGSLKTNIGHLDSAAGVGGLIKAVLSLKNRQLFPSLHYQTPNPLIDLGPTALVVNDRLTSWNPPANTPRRMGVSAFGLSGTNAHVVLEEAPTLPISTLQTTPEPGYLLTLSAKTPGALARYCQQVADHLNQHQPTLADLCYTLNRGRDTYAYRAAFVADGTPGLMAQLTADRPTNPEKQASRPTVLLFSGDGQRDDAWTDQLGNHPVFASHWRACLDQLSDNSLTDTLWLFVSQYALFHCLHSLGIDTRYRVGHGVGNLVVAVLDGSLSLADGLQRAAHFSQPLDGPNADKLAAYLAQLGQPLLLDMSRGGSLLALTAPLPGLASVCLPDATNPQWPLHLLGQYMERGGQIDWAKHYAGQNHRRLEAPTYPFDPIRCWHCDPAPDVPNTANWLFDTSWETYAPAQPQRADLREQTWLLLMDQQGVGEELATQLSNKKNRVIRVYAGDCFEDLGHDQFSISLANEADYQQLAVQLEQTNSMPDGIVHLTQCNPAVAGFDVRDGGLFSQFLLVKAFGGWLAQRSVRLVLASANAYSIRPTDTVSYPERAASFGFFRGVLAEYEQTNGTCIDLSLTTETASEAARSLWQEMQLDNDLMVSGYRTGQRYVPVLKKAVGPAGHTPPTLVKQGVYVLTGGSSGIGYEIARSMVARQTICLVVVGRSPMPTDPRQPSPDPAIRQRQERLQHLTATGSAVHYYQVDTADEAAMTDLCATISAEHGPIRGIIHAAAQPGAKSIQHNTLPEFRQVFDSRVAATRAFVAHAQQHRLDFLVIFSSISGVLPVTTRKADYAAGCTLVDALVRQQAATVPGLTLINWCDWQETGMSWRISDDPATYATRPAFLHLKSVEGIAVFEQIMRAGLGTVTPFGNAELATPRDLDYLAGNPFVGIRPAVFDTTIIAQPAPKRPVSAPAPAMLNLLPDGATATEQALAQIWAEVLKQTDFSPDDDFFDIGGQSLTGFSVIRRIEKQFGIELEIDDLFDHGTLRELAAQIDQRKPATPAQPVLPTADAGIPIAPKQPHYPLSRAQEQLWLLGELPEEWVAYNEVKVYQLDGPLNRVALEKAFDALLDRHEMLRTHLVMIDGWPRQQPIAPAEATGYLIFRDLRSSANPQRRAEEAVATDRLTPFARQNALMIRVQVLQLAEELHWLLCTVHHLISDGWSTGILIRDLSALYNAFGQGQPNPLIPLPMQFKDWVVWQQSESGQQQTEAAKQHWLSQFDRPVPALNLPLDYPRPLLRDHDGQAIQLALGTRVSAQLKSLAQQHDCTLFTVLLATYASWLYHCTGQTELVVGYPTAGRHHPDLENQVGFYLNMNAIRLQFDPDESFVDLLHHTREGLLRNLQHQQYPIDQLIDNLNLGRHPNRHPLFDVMIDLADFNASTGANAQPTLTDLHISYEEPSQSFSRFDLSLQAYNEPDAIYLTLQYALDIFAPNTIDQLADHLRTIAHRIGATPDQSIEELCFDEMPAFPAIGA